MLCCTNQSEMSNLLFYAMNKQHPTNTDLSLVSERLHQTSRALRALSQVWITRGQPSGHTAAIQAGRTQRDCQEGDPERAED